MMGITPRYVSDYERDRKIEWQVMGRMPPHTHPFGTSRRRVWWQLLIDDLEEVW